MGWIRSAMRRAMVGAGLTILAIFGLEASASAQDVRIGILDFYGLRDVTPAQIRAAITLKEGDALQPGAMKRAFAEQEQRLAQLTGVVGARLNAICCDDGRAIVYIGIQERGAPTLQFRDAPRGAVRLPDEVRRGGEAFERAMMDAVRRGDAEEDDSSGHSLMHDAASRAIQEGFIGVAARDLQLLRDVLHDSSEAADRALAAQVLGYVPDKRVVVGDLAHAMSDPAESVRNNAMRALAVIAAFAAKSPDLGIDVRFEPFIDLLNSPVWTDRNKASFAIEALSASRDARLFSLLRERALGSLVEMARWKSDGHAGAAFFTLGRMGGLSEDEIDAAWKRHDREAVVQAASKGR
jgi:hypothetical protein